MLRFGMKLAPLALLLLSASLHAQQPAPKDTTHKNTSADSSADEPARMFSAGVSFGQLAFSDGSRERAFGASVGVHLFGFVDISISPTYAWATSAPVVVTPRLTRPGRTVSGLADLPVSIGVSHGFDDFPASPSISLSLGATLPVGDTTAVGSGTAGTGLNLDFGLQPTDLLSLNFGVGHALSSAYSVGLASSSTTSLGAGGTLQLGKVGVSIGYSADVGTPEVGFENARSVSGGLNIPLIAGYALNLDGSRGLTKGAPDWVYSIGIGTTSASIAAVSARPYKALARAFGAGTKKRVKPATKKKGRAQKPPCKQKAGRHCMATGFLLWTSSRGGTRTPDRVINSHLLYHLSYSGIA